jgi:hypothetical protein
MAFAYIQNDCDHCNDDCRFLALDLRIAHGPHDAKHAACGLTTNCNRTGFFFPAPLLLVFLHQLN